MNTDNAVILNTVLQCCLDHPEWGTPNGARLQGTLVQCWADYPMGPTDPAFRRQWHDAGYPEEDCARLELAEVTVAEALWDKGFPASHIYDMDRYGDGSGVVHGGVLVGDLVVDVTARRFDPSLPFPLILPLGEWELLSSTRAAA